MDFLLTMLFLLAAFFLFCLVVAFLVGFSDSINLNLFGRCYNLGEKLAAKINKIR